MNDNIHVRICISRGFGEEYHLGLEIAPDQFESVALMAAGVEGVRDMAVEHFVRMGVRDLLLTYAEKTMPEVRRIREHRDLMHAAMQRGEMSPRRGFELIEDNARRELRAREVESEDAFAKFLWQHYGNYWSPENANGPWERRNMRIPARVDALVAKMAEAHYRRERGL